MSEWLSDHRASIAAVLIIMVVVMFIASIVIGIKQSALSAKDEVFGDPERTKGGWYWTVCGVATLLLVWFYFSWGAARAYFPDSANEMCQIAKIEEAISPIKASLPLGSRYFKSTTLVARNSEQLVTLQAQLPTSAFSTTEQANITTLFTQINGLIANSSDPANLDQKSRDQLVALSNSLDGLSSDLKAGYEGLTPSAEALAQPKWGTTYIEIPILPTTTTTPPRFS